MNRLAHPYRYAVANEIQTNRLNILAGLYTAAYLSRQQPDARVGLVALSTLAALWIVTGATRLTRALIRARN